MFARVIVQAAEVALDLREDAMDIASSGSCTTRMRGGGLVVVAFTVTGGAAAWRGGATGTVKPRHWQSVGR